MSCGPSKADGPYKLVYFNGRGRGEPVRYVFALSRANYTDERLPSEDWPAFKEKTPFGTLPILHIGNTVLSDSKVICRFLAHRFGLMGKTPIQAGTIDMLVMAATDTAEAIIKYVSEKNESTKASLKEKFKKEALPKFVKLFENQLGSNDWLVGNKVSLADLIVFDLVAGFFDKILGDECKSVSPKLLGLVQRFEKIPQIEKYIKERPETSF